MTTSLINHNHSLHLHLEGNVPQWNGRLLHDLPTRHKLAFSQRTLTQIASRSNGGIRFREAHVNYLNRLYFIN